MIQRQGSKLLQDCAMGPTGSIESVNEESLKAFQSQRLDLAPGIEAIINKYGVSLYLYAKAELGCEDAADEVLQQTWLALYLEGVKSGLAWLRSPTIYSWLRTVIQNRVYDYRKQRKATSLDAEEVMWALEQSTDLFERPDIMSIRDEMVLEILDVILRTVTSGDAFIMFSFHCLGYSSKDLARMLSFSENTIKSRLRRARERLKRALEDSGIQVRDIKQVGGLKERFDQVLAWLALDAMPKDEWDAEVVQPILQRESEHPLWVSVAFDFLNEWDTDVALRYQVCSNLTSPRRTLRGGAASFLRRNESKELEKY
jgi:RNA polymerase sigma-70 factor, ECF subfamily